MMEWINFYLAADKICERLGLSRGAARKTLQELCASREVRSQKQPYSMVGNEFQGEGPPVQILPAEWRTTEVDLTIDADGCRYLVDVSKEDFEYWLGNQTAIKALSPRDAAILKRLRAGERPPKVVPWKKFCNDIRRDAGGLTNGRPARGFSDKQIRRTVEKLDKRTS
jgi:hypothetical protein